MPPAAGSGIPASYMPNQPSPVSISSSLPSSHPALTAVTPTYPSYLSPPPTDGALPNVFFTSHGFLATVPMTTPTVAMTTYPVVPPLTSPPPAVSTASTMTPLYMSSPPQLSSLPIGLTTAMEIIWHGEFDNLFSRYLPHRWTLHPSESPPPGQTWRVFKDSAKVRFSCSDCGHGWTSMKGRVAFWFNFDLLSQTGVVFFRLFGQVCQRCNNGRYEHAMWYPEEVVKVVGNVYNRVGQVYYGFDRPPLRVDRRQGKPRDQHNAQHCEACKEGLCREEWSFS